MKCIFCRIYDNICEQKKEREEKKNNKEIIKIRIKRTKAIAQIYASLAVVLSLFASFYEWDFIKHLNISTDTVGNNINRIIIFTFILRVRLYWKRWSLSSLYDQLEDLEFNETKKTTA